jgi:formylmethanofuran dehydrogenase subunit B
VSGSGTPSATASGRRTCTVCPLLCDDILPAAGRYAHACDAGVAAFAAAAHAGQGPAACHDGAALLLPAAIDRAAAAIVGARRVLVTGLADATLESVTLACDLAEVVGAAVDAGDAETAQAAGPTVARIGGVTADWEELRDRANLVVFWFCDPHDTHPRFVERFVDPLPAGAATRRTIAVGPAPVLAAGPTHEHLALPESAAIDAARLVQALICDRNPHDHQTAVGAACETVRAAIEAAACVAFVTRRGSDPGGLASWSAAGLVQSVAHRRPAFEAPLGAGLAGPGANGTGAAAICTWRYGADGAIAAARRCGAEFLPGESDARRLVARGEVDCVVAVGRLTAGMEEALAARGPTLALVRIAATFSAGDDAARPAVRLRCASPLVAPAGTMLRGDGRRIELSTNADAADDVDADGSMTAILAALLARVRDMRNAEGVR